MRIQDLFNYHIDNIPFIDSFPSLSEMEDAISSLYERWRRVSLDNLTYISARISQIRRHSNVFDDVLLAITNPTLYDIDFLISSMPGYAGFRPLWTFLTGVPAGEWDKDFYQVRVLLRILPIDVVAIWLQLKGNHWKRGLINREPIIYQPILDDYPKDSIRYLAERKIILQSNEMEFSALEYLDRSFLGSGGLYADYKRLATGTGYMLKCQGFVDGTEVTLPPISWEAETYLTQLMYGRIMPFHYLKILENYANPNKNCLGIGANSLTNNERK